MTLGLISIYTHWSAVYLNCRLFTYVERGIFTSCKIVNVGNAEGLDGHRPHAEQQLSDGHKYPHLGGVSQAPGIFLTT